MEFTIDIRWIIWIGKVLLWAALAIGSFVWMLRYLNGRKQRIGEQKLIAAMTEGLQ